MLKHRFEDPDLGTGIIDRLLRLVVSSPPIAGSPPTTANNAIAPEIAKTQIFPRSDIYYLL